ncbi:MAG: hypothetical protein M0T77_05285 [Actinomycetota bacterium]|nr:hypothetical protein [Actinomycetota bacterium]
MSSRIVLRVGLGLVLSALLYLGTAATAVAGPLKPSSFGELDCNGQSTVQTSVNRRLNCTDVRGFSTWTPNTWNGRFYDNGLYIGHDEPDMTFLSTTPGSGNNVTWTETLPRDPSAAPTVKTPGSDVSHWFELTVAPWFSMAMCDPNSYPEAACTPLSDSNASTCAPFQTTGCYAGGGSAFMELQLYPPGMPPFVDSTSCNDTQWCAALTIDSLECTSGFTTCNPACIEPVNFAWIQTNGVPTGPASPQLSNLATFTPNSHTLMMNPGDQITVHMYDAKAPGGGHAFEVVIQDLTTGQTGYMQASAANGFANTSPANCSGTPFNFQPEYATAAKANIVPWAALQTNISTEFEIGHFTPCTSVSSPATLTLGLGVHDTYYNTCNGPYEAAAGASGDGPTSLSGEVSDALCYPAGDTHGQLRSAPDLMSGCMDDFAQNGDLDFDGSSYWPEWPTGSQPTATLPGSFVQQLPTTAGKQYAQFFMQTDTALSESTCQPNGTGCALPPPTAPGAFYPYWTRVTSGHGRGQATCTIEFGNVSTGAGVNDFSGDAQYGSDLQSTLGYPEFEGPVMSNACG